MKLMDLEKQKAILLKYPSLEKLTEGKVDGSLDTALLDFDYFYNLPEDLHDVIYYLLTQQIDVIFTHDKSKKVNLIKEGK